jgi:hypothetical protein
LSVEIQVEKVEDLLDDGKLATFRDELQQLLVSWTWHIRLAEFLQLYKQRYTHDVDLKAFGVENLESLLQKVFNTIHSVCSHFGHSLKCFLACVLTCT